MNTTRQPLKIHIVSDLHLEFAKYEDHTNIDCDVVVLAGDIAIGAKGIAWARERWADKEIIYVAGNHEYYGGEFHEVNTQLEEAAKLHGVHFLNRKTVVIGDVRFVGATLWTGYQLFGSAADDILWAQIECSGYLADHRRIRYGKGVLRPTDALDLHNEDLAFIRDQLMGEYHKGPTVVVTHHLPLRESVSDRYKKELASSGFASDLKRFMGLQELWIHGHTHDTFDYVHESGTRVVCNPRGYVTYRGGQENYVFNPRLVVEV